MVEAIPPLRAEKATPSSSGELPSVARRINFRKEDTKVWQQKRDELTKLVQDKDVDTILLIAATGTGKTFAGSQIMLEAIGPTGKMVMTENLRRATEKSAEDVAADREEEAGDVVGYQNKYHRKVSKNTRLLFCPMQSLLNKVEHDKTLEEYDLIMVDEVHKESKQNEILLATLKDIQKKRRASGRPLKLVLTSATMDKDKLGKYFSESAGEAAKRVREVTVEGDNIPLEPTWHKEKVPMDKLASEAAEKVRWSIQDQKDKGNILVFLSGKAQIDEAKKTLEGMKLGDDVEIVRYLGTLTKQENDAITKKLEKEGKRLVFLATNAAQESLTWPLKVVIDTCTHKHHLFDAVTGRSYLVEEPAPQDHLTQRKGRIGRKKPAEGEPPDRYYPLTTKDDWEGRPKFETPEIQRTDLTAEVLTMVATGYDPYNKDFFVNNPSPSHIDSAFNRLKKIGAWDGKNLTTKGILMAQLQLNVNNASLVADGIKYGKLEDATALATMLEIFSNADAFEGNTELLKKMSGREKSDLIPLINLFKNYQGVSEGERAQWALDQGLRADKLADAADLYTSIILQVGEDKSIDRNPSQYGLELALNDSFADTKITGYKKHYLKLEGVGGEAPLSVDNHSVLASNASREYEQFVSTNIRAYSKSSYYSDVIDGRSAGLNHVFSEEAKKIINRLPEAAESKSTSESESQKSKVESLDIHPDIAQATADAEVPQIIEEKEEEKPPEKPLPFYKRWWNGFTGWLSRVFGS